MNIVITSGKPNTRPESTTNEGEGDTDQHTHTPLIGSDQSPSRALAGKDGLRTCIAAWHPV